MRGPWTMTEINCAYFELYREITILLGWKLVGTIMGYAFPELPEFVQLNWSREQSRSQHMIHAPVSSTAPNDFIGFKKVLRKSFDSNKTKSLNKIWKCRAPMQNVIRTKVSLHNIILNRKEKKMSGWLRIFYFLCRHRKLLVSSRRTAKCEVSCVACALWMCSICIRFISFPRFDLCHCICYR